MKGLAQLLTLIMFLVVMLTNTLSKTIDPYKVLGIGRDATQDDIRQGFKKRSKKYHPDVNKEDPRAK
jgi:DnaJ-class molecular chaperone